MRLNFSGVGEEQIREGVRRLGEVVREQVALYGTLTGAYPPERPGERHESAASTASAGPPAPAAPAAPTAAPSSEAETVDDSLANVLRLPRKRA
jgi:2-aminoadipate transaminase